MRRELPLLPSLPEDLAPVNQDIRENCVAADSIILDTNILVSLLVQGKSSTLDLLKFAALTHERFYISVPTLEELERWARGISKQATELQASLEASEENFDTWLDRHQAQLSPGDLYFLGHRTQESAAAALSRSLESLLKLPGFEILQDADIRLKNPDMVKGVTDSLIQTQSSRRRRTTQAVMHDAYLVATSKVLQIPVLTLDQTLINAFGDVVADIAIPFPFDGNEIMNLELEELLEIATPVRRLYRQAFGHIHSDLQTINSLRNDAQVRMDFLEAQRRQLASLQADLMDIQTQSELWRKLAKPSWAETLTMTLVESGLGFAPVPIPTSPFSHFLRAWRFHKADRMRQ